MQKDFGPNKRVTYPAFARYGGVFTFGLAAGYILKMWLGI
jgi:hypothetical protein